VQVPGNIRRAEHFVHFLRRLLEHMRRRMEVQAVHQESPRNFLDRLQAEVGIDGESPPMRTQYHACFRVHDLHWCFASDACQPSRLFVILEAMQLWASSQDPELVSRKVASVSMPCITPWASSHVKHCSGTQTWLSCWGENDGVHSAQNAASAPHSHGLFCCRP
jgi:uncharacterized protein involved in type VI secretion and phage assembly